MFQASTELMQAQAVLGGIHVSQNRGPKACRLRDPRDIPKP